MKYLITAVIILSVTTVILLIRNHLLRKGYDELTSDIKDQVSGKTSVPVSLSTTDSHARKTAVTLNDELKKLNEERQRYEEGNRRISKTVTGISHDLRTPLTAINSYLDLLEDEKDESVRTEYLQRIKNRTRSLTALTEELFNYSSVADKEEYVISEKPLTKLDLKKALEECLLSFYRLLQEKGIEPDITLPEDEVIILSRQEHVDRILENVISNAVKYSDDDLHIMLTSDGTVTLRNKAPSMSTVSVQKLFDRYYTVNDQKSSTGLGLSIARDLITKNGGTIDAEYKNGELITTLRFVIS